MSTRAVSRILGGVQLGRPVHVRNYGVVGDGTTNDTSAFQAALDSGYPLDVSGMTIALTAVTIGSNDSPYIWGGNTGTLTYHSSLVQTSNINRVIGITRAGVTFDSVKFVGGTSTDPGASFTGTISGTTLTVSGVSGTILSGQRVLGSGVTANTFITGGAGASWTVNNSQSVGPVAMTGNIYPAVQTMINPITGSDDLTIRNCVIEGGSMGVYGQPGDNFLVDGCTIRHCYQEALAPNSNNRTRIVNCAIHDGGYANVNNASAAIRCGVGSMTTTIEDVTIIGNQIVRWNENTDQEAIDCYAGALRNVMIANNLIANCGHGGVEIKTNGTITGSPDNVYQNWVIADNLVYLNSNDGIGFALNNAAIGTPPDAKAAYLKVSGNHVIAPSGSTGTSGINLTGWLDVELSDNKIRDTVTGILVSASNSNTSNTLFGVALIGNVVYCSGIALYTGIAATTNDMHASGNHFISTADHAVQFQGDTINRLVFINNYVETQGTNTNAADFRNIQTGEVKGNVFKNAAGSSSQAVFCQGTASTALRFSENTFINPTSGKNAVRVDSGTVEFYNNRADIPVNGLGVNVTGSGTVTNVNMNRGYTTTNPGSNTGAVGDRFYNSTPAIGAPDYWVCKTAGGSAWEPNAPAGLPSFQRRIVTTVNFNSANTDNAVTISLPPGTTRYMVREVWLSHFSATGTTATCGLFTSTGGGGTAIVTSATAITVSTASESSANNAQLLAIATGNTQSFTTATLQFRVQTAQGSACTGDVTVVYEPIS